MSTRWQKQLKKGGVGLRHKRAEAFALNENSSRPEKQD